MNLHLNVIKFGVVENVLWTANSLEEAADLGSHCSPEQH